MNAWITPALLGLIAVLLAANFIRAFVGPSDGGAPAWSVACGGGLCVALDDGGKSYWGLRDEGAATERPFRWYAAGNVRESEPFGIAACRERIERFERERATLEARLEKLSNPAKPAGNEQDAMEAARQNMLAKLERLDTQKSLDKLLAEQGAAAEQCRKVIEMTR